MSIIELATNIEEMQEFDPLPAGLFPGECQDLEVRFSEKKPNGYIYCQLRISPDHFPQDYDVDNAPEGMIVVYAQVSIPTPQDRRAVKPFINFHKAFGVTPSGNQFNPEDFIGKSCQIILTRGEYPVGTPINQVEGIQPLPTV